MSHKAYSLQTRLTAELFTRYECHAAARNIGLTLHQERSLKALHEQLNAMPKPRWIIGGSYQRGRLMGNGWREADIELVIVNAQTGKLEREICRNKGGQYDDAKFLADKVADKLGLKPRPRTQVAAVDRSKEVWAVLPFQELLELADYDKRFNHHRSNFLSYQLQQSGRLGKLVDREQTEQLLREHRIQSLNRVDSGSAAMLGRLLHADKILCGMLTNGPETETVRLDLLLIDCASGAIVNIQSGFFPKDKTEENLAEFAKRLLDSPDRPPPRTSGTINSSLESQRLMSAIQNARTVQRNNTILTDQVISLGESFYLLNPESVAARNELFQTLIDNLFSHSVPADWRHLYRKKSTSGQVPLLLSVEQGKALANFLLPMIDTLPARPHGPRSLEAMRFYLLSNAERFEEAEESIARGRAAGNKKFWAYQKGAITLLRGNPKAAGNIFLKSGFRAYAVYAYYLAGEKFLAYQTAKKARPIFFHLGNGECMMIYLELLETFESTAAAQAWFEQYDKEDTRRGSRAKRTFLGKETAYMSKEFKRLRESAGKPVKFVDAAKFFHEFRTIPVYLQGLGSAPENAFEPASNLLRKVLGLEVVIPPPRTIPTTGIYHPGHRQFQADKLLRAVRFAYGEKYPDKGALMMCVTSEALYLPRLRLTRSVYLHSLPKPGSLGVISGAYMPAETFDKAIAISVARLLLLHALPEPPECANFPCLFAPLHPRRIQELDFKLCESCAQKVEKAEMRRTIQNFGAPGWDKAIDEADKKIFETCRTEFSVPTKKSEDPRPATPPK